jgi:outer membrane PBP1 activator LpoA protein
MIALHRHLPIPPAPGRKCRSAFAFALATVLSALSAAQSPPASDDQRAQRSGERAGAIADDRAGAPAIALVLPLASPTFGRAAEAVRAGFIAAADATKTRFVVIGHGDDDVLAAIGAAGATGARVIVGPLVRYDLKAVAAARPDLPPIIALNQLDDGASLPAGMYALTLTIDGDARQLARRARDAGALSVAVIASDTPLQQRFASAFNAEWILTGGSAPAMFRFDRAPDELRALRRDLAKTPFDAALLAIDGADVALAKPYLKSIVTYTSNQVNDRQPTETLRDLDDVVFVDIPWLVDPDASAVAGFKHPDYPNAALDRLHALGIDAFRVAQAFVDGVPEKLTLDGATGRLSLDPTRQFVREGRLMVFRSGRAVSAEAR